ncbi:MAG: UDP-N-acetylmuramoyl-tripeptide--D-alanyl-D-alanine ligase [Paenibacillaceae bacterium]|nr:UDP-N-acetylmuramoyl-tripeptide--D-alanyl-D-alanine ligase [Paenibacillaceae bacterium]
MKYKGKSGTVTLIGDNGKSVKVCDIKNGKPQVRRLETADYYEFTLIYSFFRRVKKKFDKKNLRVIK